MNSNGDLVDSARKCGSKEAAEMYHRGIRMKTNMGIKISKHFDMVIFLIDVMSVNVQVDSGVFSTRELRTS